MARKKRTDNRGRVLKTGESQGKDGRYCYRWTDLAGKRCATYALSLVELRGKEKEIERDLTDGIDTRGGDMTLNQLFELFMKTKASIRESTRCNYENF